MNFFRFMEFCQCHFETKQKQWTFQKKIKSRLILQQAKHNLQCLFPSDGTLI
jgi:hypothetical protein